MEIDGRCGAVQSDSFGGREIGSFVDGKSVPPVDRGFSSRNWKKEFKNFNAAGFFSLGATSVPETASVAKYVYVRYSVRTIGIGLTNVTIRNGEKERYFNLRFGNNRRDGVAVFSAVKSKIESVFAHSSQRS